VRLLRLATETQGVKVRSKRRLQRLYNRGVVYLKSGSVEVQNIDFPTFRNAAQISNGTRTR
jgi:hypothetical protein